MNTNLLNVLKEIVSRYGGVETLSDIRRVKALLADLAAAEPRPQKNALIACLERGFAAMLQNVPAEEHGAAKTKLAEQLNREEGLDAALCADTLDLLEAVVVVAEEAAVEQREAEKTPPRPVPADPDTTPETSPDASVFVYRETEAANSFVVFQDYEEKCGEAEALKERLKKTKNGLTAAIVIGIIVLIISIAVGKQQYDEEMSYQNNRYNSLEIQYKTLQSDYNALNWAISVISINVGNSNANNNWINRPGEELKASAMRYLRPVITYNSWISGDVTLYIKIIRPDGTLSTGSSSPPNYSYTVTRYVNFGKDQTWELVGWGNSDSSMYPAGKYQVEIWYKGFRIGSTTVTLN